MQNFPGVHGLTLSNLIYYQKGLSQKSEIATTETLEHMVFEGKLGEKIKITDEQLLIQGFCDRQQFVQACKRCRFIGAFFEAHHWM